MLNIYFANKNQAILFFQPRFGNIDINGRKPKWLHHDRSILNTTAACVEKNVFTSFAKADVILFFKAIITLPNVVEIV